jgi:NAD(P)-dependent dehydrogenase (short-subunit alcohol dehydrogenase family)
MSVLDEFRLDARVAIVTGASSGLGVSVAKAYAQTGAGVVIAARRIEKLAETEQLVTAAGRRLSAFRPTSQIQVNTKAMVDAAIAEFGRVDILVNNVGIGTGVPAIRETANELRAVVDVNLNGSYWAAQARGRVRYREARSSNVSSILGLTTADLPQTTYSASRAGVIGLTRVLAQ